MNMNETFGEIYPTWTHHEVMTVNEVLLPVQTATFIPEHSFSRHLLESEGLGEVSGISNILVGCGIQNKEQTATNFDNYEPGKQMSVSTENQTSTIKAPESKKRRKKAKQNESITWHKCSSCNYKSRHKSNLESHYKRKHEEKPDWHKCSLCEYKSKSKDNLAQHLRTQHGMNPEWHHCHQCEFKTTNTYCLSAHIKHIHKIDAWFQCEFCEFKTTDKSTLETHFEQKHDKNAKLYVCSMCSYNTRVKKYLDDHTKYYHYTDTEWYRCQFCHFKTKYENTLEEHKKKHNPNHKREKGQKGLKWYHCDSCEFKSTNLWCLECHTKYSHNSYVKLNQHELKIEEKPTELSLNFNENVAKEEEYTSEFKCNSCEFKSTSLWSLEHHLKNNHNVNNKLGQVEFKIEEKTDLPLNVNRNDTEQKEYTNQCEIKTDSTSDFYKKDVQQELADYCVFKPVSMLNSTDNNAQQENCVEQCVFEAEQKTYITLRSSESYMQQECSDHVLLGKKEERNSYSDEKEPDWYQCGSCEFKSTSQWYLNYHSKYSHAVADKLDHYEFKIEKI